MTVLGLGSAMNGSANPIILILLVCACIHITIIISLVIEGLVELLRTLRQRLRWQRLK